MASAIILKQPGARKSVQEEGGKNTFFPTWTWLLHGKRHSITPSQKEHSLALTSYEPVSDHLHTRPTHQPQAQDTAERLR